MLLTLLPRSTGVRAIAHRRAFSTSPCRLRPFDIVFCGSDDFSCRVFRALHDVRSDLVRTLLVVTPPDARTGRKLKQLYRPPLRQLAEQLSIPTLTLTCDELKSWQPPAECRPTKDALFLTASFGCLIPRSILSLYERGHALNVHPSLLPRYRGAAPIQWAISNGDSASGATVQELSLGKFDQGSILAQQELALPADATYGSIEPIYADAGGRLLVDTLMHLDERKTKARAQDPTKASRAPKITRDHARIRWHDQDAQQLLRLQRAIGHQHPLWTTFPGAKADNVQLELDGDGLGEVTSGDGLSEPGQSTVVGKALVVRCAGESVVRVARVKMPGKKWIDARDWLNGLKGQLSAFM